jgi:hypothetical protein
MMNLHQLTARLVEDLDFEEFDELVIYDHGSNDPGSVAWLAEIEQKAKVTVQRRAAIPEESLYRSWNDTVRRALACFDAPEIDVVLLNNDIRLPSGFVSFVTAALRSGDPGVWITYPDSRASLSEGLPKEIRITPTRGLAAEGGLSGWAFAVKAELFKAELPYIDERLRFYSGDRDLIHNVETRGHYAARVEGLPCEHGLGVTRKQRPELRDQMRRDIALWWGQRDGQG